MNRFMSSEHRTLFLKAAVISFSSVVVPGVVLLMLVPGNEHPVKTNSQSDVTGDSVVDAQEGSGLNSASRNQPTIDSAGPEIPLSGTAEGEGSHSPNSQASASAPKSAVPDYASGRIQSDPRLQTFQLSAKT